jgi:hypothetical protein
MHLIICHWQYKKITQLPVPCFPTQPLFLEFPAGLIQTAQPDAVQNGFLNKQKTGARKSRNAGLYGHQSE